MGPGLIVDRPFVARPQHLGLFILACEVARELEPHSIPVRVAVERGHGRSTCTDARRAPRYSSRWPSRMSGWVGRFRILRAIWCAFGYRSAPSSGISV